jgi:hypothetical protein
MERVSGARNTTQRVGRTRREGEWNGGNGRGSSTGEHGRGVVPGWVSDGKVNEWTKSMESRRLLMRGIGTRG